MPLCDPVTFISTLHDIDMDKKNDENADNNTCKVLTGKELKKRKSRQDYESETCNAMRIE
jgi:hypothetical protein